MEGAGASVAASRNGADGNERTKHLKTIYIGSLHEETTEPLLCALFAQFGNIKNCKLRKDAASTGMYAFIEFDENKSALMAIQAMTGRVFLGRTIKVNWAASPEATSPKHGFQANHHAIFVGDISGELCDDELYEAFSKYGVISDCRIIRDPVTQKCKNYGFITYVSQESAANAIKDMNGYWIGNRSIRTNWARKRNGSSSSPSSLIETVRTPPPPPRDPSKPTYQQIDNQASYTNTTIYCGSVTLGLSRTLLNQIFSRFGTISNVRAFPEKRYGFVRFAERSSAVRAILEMNGAIVHGDSLRVSWGKEQVPESDDAAYWQYCQQFQSAYNLYMQQQSFYHANVAAQQAMQSYYSQFPDNGSQALAQGSSSSSGMDNVNANPFQAASSGADNQRVKMQTEASGYYTAKNVNA